MSGILVKNFRHAQRQKNISIIPHNEENNQSVETNSERTQI